MWSLLDVFSPLGFSWDRSAIPTNISTHSVDLVCFRFHQMLPQFVWDAGVLEGNPFTFPEVKTLLDGITVGGHRISDEEQILNLAESSQHLLSLVKQGTFLLTKETFCRLNAIVSRNEALEWGHFRDEGPEHSYTPRVALGPSGFYTPLATTPGAPELNRVFDQGLRALGDLAPFEQGLAFLLFGALHQFFFDGNKRTARLMMNGLLMSHGIDAISIPAASAQRFHATMVGFYTSKDGTPMMQFLVECFERLNG